MFWDSSALIPFLVPEDWSRECAGLLADDRSPTIWWVTPVECAAALERRRREGAARSDLFEEAYRRLQDICRHVDTVEPHATVRERAIRLVAVHPLRSADALQLAAALVACDERPRGETFVCLDERLRNAALREGFTVLPS